MLRGLFLAIYLEIVSFLYCLLQPIYGNSSASPETTTPSFYSYSFLAGCVTFYTTRHNNTAERANRFGNILITHVFLSAARRNNPKGRFASELGNWILVLLMVVLLVCLHMNKN